MNGTEALALIRELRAHIVKPACRTSYKILPGDVVLWDNFGTVHRAAPLEYSSEPGKRRLLRRISAKGGARLVPTTGLTAQSGCRAG